MSADELPRDPRIDAALGRRSARPAVMGDALLEALSTDLQPVRRVTAWQRAALPAAAAVVTVAGSALLLPRTEAFGASTAVQSAGVAALVAPGMYVVFARGPYGLGVDPRVRWGYVAASLVAFEAIAVVGAQGAGEHGVAKQRGVHSHIEGTAANAVPHETVGDAGPLGGPGECASYGTIVAALVGALMLRGTRRTAPVSPESAGAVAGVAAGLVGALALHTHGPADAAHMAVAHGAPLVVGAVVGAVVGRKTLAP